MSETQSKSKIRILGVGNAGVALLKKLNALGCDNAELVAIDTDLAVLNTSGIKNIFPCGGNLTDNMGCGGDPALAKDAALANVVRLKELSEGAEIVIILTSLGGGTGSVVAPIISKLACEGGAKCVFSLSILPLAIEGTARSELAKKAFAYLRKHSNIAISLPNDIILARNKTPLKEAFDIANECAANAVRAVVNMLTQNGIINIDYATFYKIFENRNINAFFAYGSGMGENAIDDAVGSLKNCPLLADKIPHAENILIGVTCGESFEMNKMQLLLESLKLNFDARGRVGFGVSVNRDFDTRIEISTIGVCAENAIQQPDPVSQRAPQAPQKLEVAANEKPQAQPPSPTPQRNDATPEELKSPHKRAATRMPDEPLNQPATTTPKPSPTPPPRPVLAEEEPQKKRRGFFGFGRGKQIDPQQDQPTTTKQGEFEFVEKSQQRGFFADTQPNIRNDEDLDVPTFIRRNIKITL